MRDRSFQPERDPLSGERQPGADDVIADADVPGRGDGPLEFYDAARRSRASQPASAPG